jgi:hypothetical protein
VKAFFKDGRITQEVETDLDANQLHVLYIAATKHGCHIQVPVRGASKPEHPARSAMFLNVRSLDLALTFAEAGILLPSQTLRPPPGGSGVPPPPGR